MPIPTPANPMPTGNYVVPVSTGKSFTAGNVATGTVYKAGEQVNTIVNKGLYLYPILHKYYKNLTYLLFDFNNMKNKSLKTKFLPMEGTITTDGKSLTWYEYSMFDVETAILAPAASSTTISIAKTAGYEVGDTIMIVRKEGSTLSNEKRVILSMIANTSITVNTAIALETGDKIVRAFYVQEESTEITRGASSYDYKEFKSFFQTFARSVSFKKEQLNRTYLIEQDAKNYVAQIFALNMNILLQEFNKALWVAGNVPGAKSETLGIVTAINKMAETDPSLIVDFSSATTDDEKIELFMDAIEKASASGAIAPGETLTIACNRKFLSKLARLKKDDIVYNEKIVEIDFTIFKFKNMFGQVEFFHEPMLDTLNQGSYAVLLPRSLVACKFRESQVVTDENGGIEKAKGEITVTRKITNVRDISEFDMYFEAALVLGGISSGCYLILKDL